MADNIVESFKEQVTVPKIVVSIVVAALVALGGFTLKSIAGDIDKNETKIEQKVDNDTLKEYIERDKERFDLRQEAVDDKFDQQQKAIDDKLDLILEIINKNKQ